MGAITITNHAIKRFNERVRVASAIEIMGNYPVDTTSPYR
jgi:hypothetical protein